MMKNKRAMAVLLCTLALPVPAAADGMGDMFSIMFRMMLTMMNIMANSMNSSDSWNSSLNSYGLGMNGWPLMSGLSGLGGWPGTTAWPGGFGANPWTLPPAGNPWAVPSGVNPFAGLAYGPPLNRPWAGIPGGWNAYPGAGLLDGQWYGTSGEILEVRGNRFLLRNRLTSLNGFISIDNNLVRMFTPQTGALTVYQFVRNETELVLQQPGGTRLLFYRRPSLAGLPIRAF